MAVYQIVYISAATHPVDETELAEILTRARANNAAVGITGMLVYDSGSFIQVLEGDQAIVDAVFRRIHTDDRHDAVRVLSQGYAAERDFGDWSMAFFSTETGERPGRSGFLERGFSEAVRRQPSMAKQALLAFRDGSLRRVAR